MYPRKQEFTHCYWSLFARSGIRIHGPDHDLCIRSMLKSVVREGGVDHVSQRGGGVDHVSQRGGGGVSHFTCSKKAASRFIYITICLQIYSMSPFFR